MPHHLHTGFAFAIATAAVFFQGVQSAEAGRRTKSASRTITQPGFDPDARKVELFVGMEKGTFATKVIALGPQGGNVLITNTTDEPLTVQLPDAFVAVHVLKQFQPGGNGPGNGNNLFAGPQQQQQQQQGGQQSVGGGFQQQNGAGNGQNVPGSGNGNGNPGGGGPGFFSIPPEATVGVPYVSACLNHGKPDPTPRANYKLMKVEDYTTDRALQQLIVMVGTGTLNQKATQAAVWNRTDDMSWKELAAKFSYVVIGKVPYFKAHELKTAKELSSQAIVLADERKRNSLAKATVTVIESR